MRFFTLTAIAAFLATATVHGLPIDATKTTSSVTDAIPLDTPQLTQCITQIVDNGAKVCDLTLLDGLTSTVLGLVDSTTGNLLNLNGRVLDLNTLTALVTKATGILNNQGQAVNTDSVLQTVNGLIEGLPVGKVTSSLLNKSGGNIVSNTLETVDQTVEQVLAPSGLSLDEVKVLVGQTLTKLNVAPVVEGLTGNVKKTVCETLTAVNLDCAKVLSILSNEGSLL